MLSSLFPHYCPVIHSVSCSSRHTLFSSVLFGHAGTGPVGGYQQMPQPQPPPQQQYHPTAAGPTVDADEMRRRRLQRFDNT